MSPFVRPWPKRRCSMEQALLARGTRAPIISGMRDAPVIHIIDDDDSMRASIDSVLRSMALTTRAHSSVDAFLKSPRPDAPGCLILDVRLSGVSGLDFQAQL